MSGKVAIYPSGYRIRAGYSVPLVSVEKDHTGIVAWTDSEASIFSFFSFDGNAGQKLSEGKDVREESPGFDFIKKHVGKLIADFHAHNGVLSLGKVKRSREYRVFLILHA